MKIIRIVAGLLVFVCSFSLFAQSNEIGVFLSQPHISSASLGELPPISADVDFDANSGYGISYNRYWSPHFSTDFAYHKLNADTTLMLNTPAGSSSFDAGDIDLTSISAIGQFHFGLGRFVPYVGAGVARVSGEANGPDDPTDPTSEVTSDDLETKTHFVANAGIDFRITPMIALTADAKYFSYDAIAKDDPLAEAITLHTYIYSAGVKLRF